MAPQSRWDTFYYLDYINGESTKNVDALLITADDFS
jgi:hypothetical protein